MSENIETVTTASANRLYIEFAAYYTQSRCQWAPVNPRRVFNFAFKSLYPDYSDRMTPEQFLAAVYSTLGFSGSEPPGLFQTFDPAKYNGPRHLEDHFINLFKWKLKGRLERAQPRTDQGRPGDPTRFPNDPTLGLVQERTRPDSQEARLAVLPQVLAFLEPLERSVLHLSYWCDLSARKVGALLDLDNKKVARVHDAAVKKLREMYGLGKSLGF